MAVVGHGLIGLAMGEWVSPGARNHRLPYVWPGIMVLLAYAVDLGEWMAILCNPDLDDPRFLNHSPVLVAGISAGVCVVLGLYCRLRRPWPYVVIVGVVFSHLLLDFVSVRIAVAEWYFRQAYEDFQRNHTAALPAELCVYGAPLVWTLLLRASFARGVSPGVRFASKVLVILCAGSAWTRHVTIWAPLYVVSVLHGGIVLRRHLNIRLLWNVVPLLPLFALGATTWLAGHRLEQGRLLARQGLDREAIHVYQTALDVRSRSGRGSVYMWMGISYVKLGDLSAAERAYRKAIAVSPGSGWPEVVLARFYFRHEGTPFFQPEKAVRLLRRVLDAEGMPRPVRESARSKLKYLHKRGLAP